MMKKHAFSIEEIHRIRQANLAATHDLKPRELIEYTRRQANEGKKLLAALRKQPKKASGD
jgi:hypothetical protein